MTELLPCWHCGGTAALNNDDERCDQVICGQCGAKGPEYPDNKVMAIYGWNRRIPAPSAAEATGGGAADERAAIEALIVLAHNAWELCDNTANEDPPEVEQADWDKLSAALDVLDALPDDQPGYTMGPAAKAEWALRRLLSAASEPPAPVPPAQGWLEQHINLLTDGEGDAVTFCSPNPDFNGLPNECVVVSASWTGWTGREFRADTREECLRLAVAAMRAEARTSAAIEPAPAPTSDKDI